MKNLLEISDRYKETGLGYILWGGKKYFELNSDVPLSLNSYGGKEGFVRNEKGEVQIYDTDKKKLIKRHYYKTEWLDEADAVDYETPHYWDETEPEMWFGKTLDNYYAHPWYPERTIKGFKIMMLLPGADKGEKYDLVWEYPFGFCIAIQNAFYTINDCLYYPEFFMPIYEADTIISE